MSNPDISQPGRTLPETAIYAALETYSNVHRGSGFNSIVTTRLYEKSRKIVLDYLGLKPWKYTVIFCSPGKANRLVAQLKPGSFHRVSSADFGLAVGVSALAVQRGHLPKGKPSEAGGGTARLMSREWEIWDKAPSKFEAGTPAIVNVIAFVNVLAMAKKDGELLPKEAPGNLPLSELFASGEVDNLSGMALYHRLRETLIGRDLCVPTTAGIQPFVNLDNSASTRTFLPVYDVFRKVLKQPAEVREDAINRVREVVSVFLNAPLADYDIFFTSNTTESINLLAANFSLATNDGTESVVLGSLLEHSSNDLPWRVNPAFSMERLTVDAEGFFDLTQLEAVLDDYNRKTVHGKKRIRVVSLSGASNVLGVCNDMRPICEIVHRYGARLVIDAAQLVAHRKISVADDGMDCLAFSGHKIYAPFGAGVLVVKKGLPEFPADQIKQACLPGEENAAGIAALGKALELLQRIGMDVVEREERDLTLKLLSGLSQIEGIKVHGVKGPESHGFGRKAGVVAFDAGKIMSNVVARQLSLNAGIGIRNGCHCAHIIVKHILGVSPGLERFQHRLVALIPSINLPGVARVSLGIENDEKDVDRLLDAVKGIVSKQTGKRMAVDLPEVKRQIKTMANEEVVKIFGNG